MARHTIILANDAVRRRAIHWVEIAPIGYRVTFQEPKRSTEQNDLMWALLTDIARQRLHMGVKHPPEIWKSIFMAALGHEMKFIPTLDGKSVFPIGMKTSNLAVKEMADLITFILQWGDEQGVKFANERQAA